VFGNKNESRTLLWYVHIYLILTLKVRTASIVTMKLSVPRTGKNGLERGQNLLQNDQMVYYTLYLD